jgi:hypothetical protein
LVRLFRTAILALAGLLFVILGAAFGLFVRMNPDWVTLRWPVPRLSADHPLGEVDYEVRSALLASGWLGMTVLLALAFALLLVHLRARRQADARIRGLEREVQALRNLPILSPTPLEDVADERRTVAIGVAAEVYGEERKA